LSEASVSFESFLAKRRLALWLAEDCADEVIVRALELPWLAIWSEVNANRLLTLGERLKGRALVRMHTLADVPPTMRNRELVYVFDTSPHGDAVDRIRRRRHAEQLENKVEAFEGVVVSIGFGERLKRWRELVSALAPEAYFLAAASVEGERDSLDDATWWDGSANELLDLIARYYDELAKSDVLDLKDASPSYSSQERQM
jgi:hypothetical protein